MYFATGTCQPPFCIGDYHLPTQVKAVAVTSTHLFSTDEGSVCPCVADDPQNPMSLYEGNLVPLAIITGTLDDAECTVASFCSPSITPEKALVFLDGVNHWGVTDKQNPPTNTEDCEFQTKSQEWSNKKFARWAAVLFSAYLKGNDEAMEMLQEAMPECGVTVLYN